jgi:Fe2+ transport system protein FeoA
VIARLSDLAIGQSALIGKLHCARPMARRLLEMGLLPGTRVTLVRIAPLGDPLELRLRGYALSIRRADAQAIDLQPAGQGDTA